MRRPIDARQASRPSTQSISTEEKELTTFERGLVALDEIESNLKLWREQFISEFGSGYKQVNASNEGLAMPPVPKPTFKPAVFDPLVFTRPYKVQNGVNLSRLSHDYLTINTRKNRSGVYIPVDEIVIHCSATRTNWMKGDNFGQIKEITSWHVDDNNWSDLGYHFVLCRDGSIFIGRPIERAGAHTLIKNDGPTREHNTSTIGICLMGGHGSSEHDEFFANFTTLQYKSLASLIDKLNQQRDDNYQLSGHNEYAAKACPGFTVNASFIENLYASMEH